MRNRILLALAILLTVLVSANVCLAAGEQCSSAGGTCMDDCDPEKYEFLINDCEAPKLCCKLRNGNGQQTASFDNPIGWGTIEEVLNSVASWIRGAAGTIAVIFLIIGGVMYMISAGNKEMMERGKKTIIFAMAGLAVVVAAPTFLYEIKRILGGDTSGFTGYDMETILTNVLNFLLSIIGILAIIGLIIGSVWMFSAAGDEERYKMGIKTVTCSIIGIVIALCSLIIVKEIKILITG